MIRFEGATILRGVRRAWTALAGAGSIPIALFAIVGGTGTLVRGCTVSQNLIGLGFFGLGPGAYAGHSITSNTGNTINGPAVNLGGKLCNNALCP
jgi:hypothetical protein